MTFAEPWIEQALKDRLAIYKKRYPMFNSDRVLATISGWPAKSQRWAPYMQDKDIKSMNRSHHKLQSLRSLSSNEHL